MERDLITRLHKSFEDFMYNEEGVEFWYARDLQALLAYTQWRNFEQVIAKAKIACKTAGHQVEDHFADASKLVDIGSNTQREIQDTMLTRYACYLIAQNGDPRKEEIAFSQTYFAIQTRKQEILEQRLLDQERVAARDKLSRSENILVGVVFEHGVDRDGFARIKSKGDQTLFGGHSTGQMKRKLGVPEKRALADFLPEVTISAKNLANAMTSHKVREQNLRGENLITNEHQRNNTEVRGALLRTGITPEKLPPSGGRKHDKIQAEI